MSFVKFYGFAAWVGALHSETECSFWPADPTAIGWNPAMLLRTDLSATPSAARLGRITVRDIRIDDHVHDGGLTTIGPRWPGGSMVGGAWLASTVWDAAGAAQPQLPAARAGGRDYEYTSIQYFDNEQGNRRFYGFHGRITNAQAHLLRVDIWHPGTSISNPTRPAGSWWIDLATSADPTFTQINASKPEGAVFLDATTVTATPLITGPKLPPYKGTFGFPLPR